MNSGGQNEEQEKKQHKKLTNWKKMPQQQKWYDIPTSETKEDDETHTKQNNLEPIQNRSYE